MGGFLSNSDFFTLDVADAIGSAASSEDVTAFVASVSDLVGKLKIDGIDGELEITEELITATANKFLKAVQSAGEIYRHIAKDVYAQAFEKKDALCEPYASVIDIDYAQLPSPETVNGWTADQFVNALRHDPNHAEFNSSFRQLLHVGYKIAAQMGDRYLNMLVECEESISRNVTENLYERHLKPLFLS